MKWLLFLACLAACVSHVQAQDDESQGEWRPPPADGKPWKHAGTGLRFPQQLGDYRLAGEFVYKKSGVFIRYESLDQRARADIFIFPAPPAPDEADRHRLILREMDAVVANLEEMAATGLYKGLQIGKVTGSAIELWRKEAIPLATRTITVTRVGNSREGAQEAEIKQWIGITHLNDHLITIRHMRPADEGAAGEAGMQAFVGTVLQVIKDPPLRAEVRGLIDFYLAEPFSENGIHAASMVLTYLDQTPFYPVSLPEEPISTWLQESKTRVEGSETHLLRAFMIGSAKAALEEASAETVLNEGSRQFARIYRQMVSREPKLADPEIEAFAAAAEKGEGANWLRTRALRR